MSSRKCRRVVDVVVVGSSAAGVAAALTAARSGASAQVIDKAQLLGGASTSAGGEAWIPCNDRMIEAGLDDSFDDAVRYLKGLSGDGQADPVLIERFVKKGAKAIRFLEQNSAYRAEIFMADADDRADGSASTLRGRSLNPAVLDARRVLGGTWRWVLDPADSAPIPGEASLQPWPVKFAGMAHPITKSAAAQNAQAKVRSGGTALITGLIRGALDAGVMFRRNCTVSRLLVDSGEVIGAVVDQGADEFEVHARRGVILACGGFVDGQHPVGTASGCDWSVYPSGGLSTDVHGRVRARCGDAVDGLYAVGSAAADIFGGSHPSPGAALGQHLTFGYLAGCHAAHSSVRPVGAGLTV